MPDSGGPGLGDLLNMGITTGLCVAVGLALGLVADHFLGTTPVLLLVGIALGVGGATSYVYALLRRYL